MAKKTTKKKIIKKTNKAKKVVKKTKAPASKAKVACSIKDKDSSCCSCGIKTFFKKLFS